MIRRPNAVVHAMREMLNGATLRAMMDIRDAGESLLARVKDIAGGLHYNTDGDADVWINYVDETSGHPGVGRLHIPAGILFGLPEPEDTCLVVHPRDVRAPGAAYVFHGDGGNKERFPDWIATKVGLFTRKVLRLESKDETVEVQAGSGKDIVLNGGNAKVGRVGDTVDCGTLYLTIAGGAVTAIAHVPPGGPPGIGTPVTMTGKISAGANNVKA